MRALALAMGLPLLLSTAGCFPWWLFDDDDPPLVESPLPESPPPPVDAAPTIEVVMAEWPPLSETSTIDVICRDDLRVAGLGLQFHHGLSFTLSGVETTTTVSGTELGEGFGALEIAASDSGNNVAHHVIDNVLVDLSPPEITLGATVLPQGDDSSIELWVADAWILGDVTLSIGGVTLEHAFEPGYPSTLGTTWDVSLVKFPTSAFPAGSHDAVVQVRDAVGHAAFESFPVTLDGEPPSVAITSPQPGATVSGTFAISVSAADAGDGPTWIEVFLDGTPVGTAVGPSATVTLDAAEMAPGPALLEATAHDQAGHTTTTTLPITIAPS